MKLLNYIYPAIIAILAVIIIFEKCSNVQPPSTEKYYKVDTIIDVRIDTFFHDSIIYKFIPKSVYMVDTIIKQMVVNHIDTIQADLTIDSLDCNIINVYVDSIKQDDVKLDYTIVTQGELLLFYPELTATIRNKVVYKTPGLNFVVEPMVGVSSPKLTPAIGIRLGYKNYSASYIRIGNENVFMTGYRFRF